MEIYTDGATVGHNGRLGTVSRVGLGVYIPALGIRISEQVDGISNNEAEFKALILGMETAIARGIKAVEFKIDSTIVVNRANKNALKKQKRPSGKHRNLRMDAFQDRVLALVDKFETCRFVWIPREHNSVADYLSKAAAEKLVANGIAEATISVEKVPFESRRTLWDILVTEVNPQEVVS